MTSIPKSKPSELLLCLLHNDHGSTISKEYWLATGNKAAPKSPDSLILPYIAGSFYTIISNGIVFGLGKILKHL